MDPDGHFVDAFRKTNSEDDVVERVKKEIAQWDEERGGGKTLTHAWGHEWE